ncbi:MAG: M20/M25/M40 family metallo-hydrolase [Cytophagales bacterium]|nr:M20/M25/M40 family metallo-hydrolase [Bacteroidota bacterium]MBS1980959.1 M20/M25/M40 family metallo-hydrolase [Bacteroidota bacterium]WHZ08318.1 MAG: M20/M25/M40 family metallo-hydrolase [Cytophagales bacterium]
MKIVIHLLFLLAGVSAFAQIEEAKLRQHIKTLSADSLNGRGTGSEGEKMAASYIISQFKKIKLQPKGESNGFFQAFPFKGGMHGTGTEGTGHNIIGYIDNEASYTVIIGAHYDHLGLGENGNSLDANPQGKIHNGADDNASGTAGLIELARYFQKNKKKEKYNFLFISFSGEELGLFGSKYFTEHPTIDLQKVNYMINLDMVGRLDPATKALAVSGTGTSNVWETELKKITTELKIKTDSAGIGPSDHSSFYLKNIPVLHFFTGAHSDYHKPSDDWQKINYSGEKRVLELIIKLIEDLDGTPRLAFLPTKNKSLSSSRSFKVTMGIMPSYTSSEEGLTVDGVTDGKPAQKAGIQAGDVIVQMGELTIKDIQAYMDALGKFQKGQTIPVKVKRKGELLTLTVSF